jgi:putative hemolysin
MLSWLWFLIFTFSCIMAEAFFSMFEMACVSLNKVRLHYYCSKNYKRAIWLKFLLNKPSRLFGTTLIAVNTALQVGSESSRRFYESLNLSPDFAPFTQIILVVIFAELAPMFAARRYSEHVAFLGVPVVYFISKIFIPFVWIIDGISRLANLCFGKSSKSPLILSREELQRAFEEKSQKSLGSSKDVDAIVGNIFFLKKKKTSDVMLTLDQVKIVPSTTKIDELRDMMKQNKSSFDLVYHKHKNNIIGIVYDKDLLQAQNNDRIVNYMAAPWFVMENDSILQLLNQFRHNNQRLAIVLDFSGNAKGLISLDQIIDDIFGIGIPFKNVKKKSLVERTLSGEMLIKEFNDKFHATLYKEGSDTLSDYICVILDHHPSEGDVVYAEQFELIVQESSLLGVKTVLVKTVN